MRHPFERLQVQREIDPETENRLVFAVSSRLRRSAIKRQTGGVTACLRRRDATMWSAPRGLRTCSPCSRGADRASRLGWAGMHRAHASAGAMTTSVFHRAVSRRRQKVSDGCRFYCTARRTMECSLWVPGVGAPHGGAYLQLRPTVSARGGRSNIAQDRCGTRRFNWVTQYS